MGVEGTNRHRRRWRHRDDHPLRAHIATSRRRRRLTSHSSIFPLPIMRFVLANASPLATTWSQTTLVYLFLVVGLVGGFTTWAHFIIETDQLVGADQCRTAVAYVVVSIILARFADIGRLAHSAPRTEKFW